MLISAPFDNWWHDAYGLDVKIISPPHVLLFLGNGAIQMGGLILILGEMNRAEGKLRTLLNWLFLYAGAMLALGAGIFIMAYSFPNQMHSALSYRVVSTTFPFMLAVIGFASHQRWASTKLAAMYMLFFMAAIWILPLFPAEPKLGPVYQKVTHFIRRRSAAADRAGLFLDLLREMARRRLASFRRSRISISAVVPGFQWPFATFLLSPGARNWFFSSHYIDFMTRPTGPIEFVFGYGSGEF
jgi:hypothetical protein